MKYETGGVSCEAEAARCHPAARAMATTDISAPSTSVALIPTTDDGMRKWDKTLFDAETLTKMEKVLLALRRVVQNAVHSLH